MSKKWGSDPPNLSIRDGITWETYNKVMTDMARVLEEYRDPQ